MCSLEFQPKVISLYGYAFPEIKAPSKV